MFNKDILCRTEVKQSMANNRLAFLSAWRHSLVASALVIVVVQGAAIAGVIRVPADQPTIQAAINAASAGDTILISPGTFKEQIDLNGKAITLRGARGAAATIIDGGSAPGTVVRIESGEGPATVLDNLTITGAVAGVGQVACGVSIKNSSPTLRRLILADNVAGAAGSGAGVRVRGGAPDIGQLVFLGNTAYFGGGLSIESSQANVWACYFAGNTGTYGGGLSVSGGKANVRDSWFEGNRSTTFGGAIYINQAAMNIHGISVRDNGWSDNLPDGGKVNYTVGGGGIYTRSASGTVHNSLFIANSAAFGGGVYIATFGSAPSFVNCVVANNSGQGGIYCNDSSPKLINNTILSNDFGGVYTSSAARPILVNSIVAGHEASGILASDVFGAGLTNVSYSLIQGQTINGTQVGAGVVRGSPKLDGQFQPLPGSKVIDAGNFAAVPLGVTADLYGRPRFVDDPAVQDSGVGNPAVDLGAVEAQPGALAFRCVSDFNRSGFTDIEDFEMFVMLFSMGSISADVDATGFVDVDDYAAFIQSFEAGC